MTDWMNTMGQQAHEASMILGRLDTNQKNAALLTAADELVAQADKVLAANALDLERARENNMPLPLQDRLMLTKPRIEQIAEGMRQVAGLDDPIGTVLEMKKRPNGLLIGKQRVPLGVCAVIYEARPNVTADVFALCFKSGNAVILKGGKEASASNQAIVEIIQQALSALNLPVEAVTLMQDN